MQKFIWLFCIFHKLVQFTCGVKYKILPESIFYVLLIGFLIARKCVTDVYDIMYDDVNMCIFCIFEFHLIFNFIISAKTDSFKPE